MTPSTKEIAIFILANIILVMGFNYLFWNYNLLTDERNNIYFTPNLYKIAMFVTVFILGVLMTNYFAFKFWFRQKKWTVSVLKMSLYSTVVGLLVILGVTAYKFL